MVIEYDTLKRNLSWSFRSIALSSRGTLVPKGLCFICVLCHSNKGY